MQIEDRGGVLFSGDLSDPWVRALAGAITGEVERVEGTVLPGGFPGDGPVPGSVVLHRANLTVGEANRLRELRSGGEEAPRIILVVGPHVRYHQVMAWSDLVDVLLPEATASETIGRHLGREDRHDRGAGRQRAPEAVAVSSGNYELGTLLGEVLAGAGYEARAGRDAPEAGSEPWLVWDIPVLDPDWPARLRGESRRRRGVVAMLGLADRDSVETARANGASACLDLPGEPEDLIYVLDRLTLASGNPRADLPRPHRPRSLGMRWRGRPPIVPR